MDPERGGKGVSAPGPRPGLLEGNLGTSVRRGIGRTRGEAVKEVELTRAVLEESF